MKVKASKPIPAKRVAYPMVSILSFMMWTFTIQKQLLTYNIKSSVLLNNISFNYPLPQPMTNSKIIEHAVLSRIYNQFLRVYSAVLFLFNARM